MFGPIKNIIFDFDGTLVDTMSSVVEGLSEAVRIGRGGQAVPRDQLVASFGGTPLGILQKWCPPEMVAEAFKLWTNFEDNMQPSDMKPFDGIEKLLEGLYSNGVFMGIYTGRDRRGTLKIAKAHGWVGKYFTEDKMVCGDDGFPPKPSEKPIEYLVNKFNLNPLQTLMVGDHPFDMRAGRQSGVRTGAALWDPPMGLTGTSRSIFRQTWTRWDGNTDVDLRIETPLAILNWITGGASQPTGV